MSSTSNIGSGTEEDELTLPRASINKMIKEILPHVRVANEARDLVLTCCTEFIHLISSEANDICNQQMKKTINAEHIFAGIYSYIGILCNQLFIIIDYGVICYSKFFPVYCKIKTNSSLGIDIFLFYF